MHKQRSINKADICEEVYPTLHKYRKGNSQVGTFLKKEDNSALKNSPQIYNDSKKKKSPSSNKSKKLHKKYENISKIKMENFLKCPMAYHTNFLGTILFVIGSVFFLFSNLYIYGCLIFAFACVLCFYSNLVGATNIKLKRKNEFYGFICYIIGCLIFIIGSIYSCFKDDYYAVGSFIIGSLFFLIGAFLFFFTINLKKIKCVNYKILIVFISNFIGGVLFTVGSIFFLYSNLYIEACYCFIIGSVLFTLATWFDYIIYINDTF
ncbi:conserved Plasmodium protein, unknown function [Plasmodium gallinaceum]|uniref:YrhK domain-containing protein n=1 Tax=Plasmodium gallinaceum TaxID=5849 RepID=A0A1J1GTV1_PLAGA|nr:conserved Plasmodium protein, unknown function [Plasmodium gallinaceum]CRG95879.1 conserved Plasmodium protein, unknown function [Plasmodium gallinaceum]